MARSLIGLALAIYHHPSRKKKRLLVFQPVCLSVNTMVSPATSNYKPPERSTDIISDDLGSITPRFSPIPAFSRLVLVQAAHD